jgi:AcrR family transcriptional regulator
VGVKFPKKKRKAGQRAGLTREKIAIGALQLYLTIGPKKISLHAVAKHLKVVPTTIRTHFKGGLGELLDEVVRLALEELAPPYKPSQGAHDYLQLFFRSALTSFRQKPSLGRLVVIHMTDGPLVSPVFAERMCATLNALAPKKNAAWAFRRLLVRLSGVVMVEATETLMNQPKTGGAQISGTISALSKTEFPTLHALLDKFAEDYTMRTEPAYVLAEADKVTAALIAELAKGQN